MKKYLLVLLMGFIMCPVFADDMSASGVAVFKQGDLEFINKHINTEQFYAEQVKLCSQQAKKNDAFYAKMSAMFQGDRPINSTPFNPKSHVKEIDLPQIGIPVLTERQAIRESYLRSMDEIDKSYKKRRKARNKSYERKAWRKRNQVTTYTKFTPKIHTGPRGGKYISDNIGYKRYLKR